MPPIQTRSKYLLIYALLLTILACNDGGLVNDTIANFMGFDSDEHRSYSECIDELTKPINIESTADMDISAHCSEKTGYVPQYSNPPSAGEGAESEPQDEDAPDPDGDNIKIVSAETSAPGGACSPPREGFGFQCGFEIAWTIEYATSTLPAVVVCDLVMEGNRDLLRSKGMQDLSGTWVDASGYLNFYKAMGEYPANMICELRVGGLDGEVLASDEQAIIAPLTTTWEE